MKRAGTAGVLVVVAIVGVAAMRGRSHGPFFPRYRRAVVEPLHAAVVNALHGDPRGMDLIAGPPQMPSTTPPSLAAYDRARAAGDKRPGASSFRADSELFCDYNQSALDAQARKEGLTTKEVRELTYFGFVAMRTTQIGTVERALGRALTADERAQLPRLLDEENDAFTRTMRKLVDDGASESERWDAIRDFEDDYQNQFASRFGMTAEQFDQMLAPDGNTVTEPTPPPAVASTPPLTTPSPPVDPAGTPKPPPGDKPRPLPVMTGGKP